MKNKILIILTLLTLVSVMLLSCGTSDDNIEPAKETEAEEPIAENVDPSDYYGCWKYTNSMEWICIFEDGNFMIHGGMEELIPPTAYEATPEGLYIPKMDITLSFDEEGVLNTSDGLTLEASELAAYDLYIEYNIK